MPGSGARSSMARERRVDLLRGVALLTILIDHVPANVLGHFTLRNLGFSDAAELFVLLAGFASMLAYGNTFAREGIGAGLRRIALRCLRIYVFQVGLLLLTLAVITLWLRAFQLEPNGMFPLLGQGFKGLRQGAALAALPIYLDILPLYIVLLAMFPLIYAVMRKSPWLAIYLSGLVWAAPNLDDSLNLTNVLSGMGWFFNPFAWQFVFVIGAATAVLIRRRGGAMPRIAWVRAAAWAYLLFGFLETFAWADWGLPDLSLIHLAPPDKSNLAAWRLVHIMALIYVALTSSLLTRSLRYSLVRAVEACGKHSLEIFSLGTMIALLSRLVFRTFGVTWQLELAVNLVGMGGMIGFARLLEWRRAPLVPEPGGTLAVQAPPT